MITGVSPFFDIFDELQGNIDPQINSLKKLSLTISVSATCVTCRSWGFDKDRFRPFMKFEKV